MATHKIGFLKFNTSDDGIAFRIGDGKIHRIGFGKKRGQDAEETYDDAYMDDQAYVDDAYPADDDAAVTGGYTGRFASRGRSASRYDDYGDDYGGYDEDGYPDDRYADDDYAEDDYAEDGYSDDGYYDDDYAEGDYDDRYSDEDAGGYDDDPGYGSENPLMRYIDENDWVTYALLVLLPPLGIYLLWRRRRFETPIRWIVSAASGVWFVILLILLISAILAGGGDAKTNPPITMNPPATAQPSVGPSAEATAGSLLEDALSSGVSPLGNASSSAAPSGSAQPGATDGLTPVQTMDALSPDASATPIAGYSGGTGTTATGTVMTTATGLYYHNNPNCTYIEAGAAVSTLTQEAAIQQGKTACPSCYPGQEKYYATANGTWYHVDPNCSDMKDAVEITKEAAEKEGKTACPVCILKTVNSVKKGEMRFVTSSSTDKSGKSVYVTDNGKYYHTNATCSSMKDAKSVGLLKAILDGKTACPTCASSAETSVWFTRNGDRYHNKSDCDGMKNAVQGTLAEALILGKDRCAKCWGASTVGFNGATGGSGGSGSSGGTVYVYATENGQYYHTNSTCSGMQNATRVPLTTMIEMGRKACPTCATGANAVVYATPDGKYYHSYATCSGMKNAVAGTKAQAMALGKQECPDCWKNGDEAGSGDGKVYVYATKNGQYYHTNATCSGMTGATRGELSAAVKAGKTACPTCASAANRMVYSTSGGQYYHTNASCSGMHNAQQRTLQDALILGQSACPVCIGSTSGANSANNSTNSSAGNGTVTNVQSHQMNVSAVTSSDGPALSSSGTYKAGTSGVKVYATAEGSYYHRYKEHAGSGARQVSLETALNYGKKACPTCLSAARTTVYAVAGGRYYHRSKTCAGAGAKSGSLSSALAYGLDACPICVTRTQEVSNSKTYKSGASGLKVYATVSGSYYHTRKSCAGESAQQVTLETAMNYGKKPCPNCASAAKKTVYATSSDKYYHASRTHAGSGASSGTWAAALALGKKACPVCITGSEAYEESDVKYSASGDTQVYVDPDSTQFYYHKNARCSDAGFSGGTSVDLDFAVRWDFKACPYCNPPTSVK